MKKNNQVIFNDLGVEKDYKTIWDYQEQTLQETALIKKENRNLSSENQLITPNYLFFVEHPHVYTLGRNGKANHLLIDDNFLQKINASFHQINRGGDITYHGPGQLVGYPILDLDNFFTDIHKYLRFLEEVIIKTLSDYGIKANRSPGETGVWLDVGEVYARKICAMGIRASRWITMHGFALNVNPDLSYFQHIVPCGIQNKAVTSIEKELNKKVSMDEVKQKLKYYFEEVFDASLV
jgi:lipoyl(octanoyl) transferase